MEFYEKKTLFLHFFRLSKQNTVKHVHNAVFSTKSTIYFKILNSKKLLKTLNTLQNV